jgi:CHAT domain-containing protein/tetratricopeptide (TPR) repeat protein
MKTISSLYHSRNVRRVIVFLLSALFGLISTLGLPVWSKGLVREKTDSTSALSNSATSFLAKQTTITLQEKALQLARKGQEYYQVGQFSEAIKLWQQAAKYFEEIDDLEGKEKSLINQAQAFQDLGLYTQAYDILLQILGLDSRQLNPEKIEQQLANLGQDSKDFSATKIIALRSLGDVLRKKGMLVESKKILEISLEKVRVSNLEGVVLLSLGNTERALGNQIRNSWDYGKITDIITSKSFTVAIEPYQNAVEAYQQAATLDSTATLTVVQAEINQLTLWNEIESWWIRETNRRIIAVSKSPELKSISSEHQFLSELGKKLNSKRKTLKNQIAKKINTLPPSRTSVYTIINFAESLFEQSDFTLAESIINLAWEQSRYLQDKSAESYALGYLGKIAQQQGKLEQAIEFTQQALLLAQAESIASDVREIVYLWEAQLGQLLREKGEQKNAISAYTAAYNTLQSLRSDLNSNIVDIQFDFRQEVKPVYLELADLLLQSDWTPEELNSLVAIAPQNNQAQSLETMNGDRLQLARRVIESLQLAQLDNLFQDPCSQEAKVAVPIDDLDPQAAVIYPIILPERLELILALPGKSLSQFTVAVSEEEINETIEDLYNNLDNQSVDYSARNILATSNPTPEELRQNLETLLPLLNNLYSWLIKPVESQLDSQSIKTLVFVINGSLQRIPLTALYDGREYLVEKYGVALVPSLQLVKQQQFEQENLKIFAAGVSNSITLDGKILPSLPNVSTELEQIQQIFPETQTLVNQEFTSTSLQEQLQKNLAIVHLATHGLFGSQPEKSFIVAGDGNIINLEQLNNLFSNQTNPPQLLVLSACDTATGDEQVVLGLAGVAIRSGVSSIVATLWSVGDASTAELMSNFYQQLKKSEETKLGALRTAQLSLINSLRENPPLAQLENLPPHPYYWSPYVLVGNWL